MIFISGKSKNGNLINITEKSTKNAQSEKSDSRYFINENDLKMISSDSFCLIEKNTKEKIICNNPNKKMAIASLTKLMTALVAVDQYSTEDYLFVNLSDNNMGMTMGLKKGESVKMDDLLNGLLIQSGNDAAEVLADNCSKEKSDQNNCRDVFIEKMNDYAKKMNLVNTKFYNPSGLDGEFSQQTNYSTVNDLLKITEAFISNKYLFSIISKEYKTIPEEKNKHAAYVLRKYFDLQNFSPDILVIKSGYSEMAKSTAVFEINNKNHMYFGVILNSQESKDDILKIYKILTRE